MKRILFCLYLTVLCQTVDVLAAAQAITTHHTFGYEECLNRIQVRQQDKVIGSICYYYDVSTDLLYCERLSLYENGDMTAVIHRLIDQVIQQYPKAKRLFVKEIVASFRWTTEREAMPSYQMVRLILGQLNQLLDISPRRPNRLFSILPPV